MEFGCCSIILVGDFGQFPPLKDISMYAGSSIGTSLRHTFDTFITLEKKIQQQGNSTSQIAFPQLLLNL